MKRNQLIKNIGGVLLLNLLTINLFGSLSYAEIKTPNIYFKIGQYSYFIDNSEKKMDSQALVHNGRTMVPMKYVAEAFGGEVKWDSTTKTATIVFKDKTLIIPVEQSKIYINEDKIEMDTKLLLVEGRTMLPVAYIAKALDLETKWDKNTQIVEITKSNQNLVVDDEEEVIVETPKSAGPATQVVAKQETPAKAGVKVVYAAKLTELNHGSRYSLTEKPGYNKIETKYGYHTYGANTQAEYDKVMKNVQDTKVTLEQKTKNNGGWTGGKVVLEYQKGTLSASKKAEIEKTLHPDVLKADIKTVEKVVMAKSLIQTLGVKETKSISDSSISEESAAARLFYGQGDCNAMAYVMQVAFDSYGFNTRISYSTTHAWAEYEVNGKWYNAENLAKAGGVETGRSYVGTLVNPTNSLKPNH